MPAQDLIFQRLKAATDAELHALGRALDEKIIDEPRFYIALLSKKLRADAGTAVGNLRRGDHDLTYRQILEDVAASAADAAGWERPAIDALASEESIEDYILQAFALRSDASVADREQARRKADIAISGRPVADTVATLPRNALRKVGAFVGGAIEWVASGAMRRVAPAVLVLIHIRKRIEIEQTLQGAA